MPYSLIGCPGVVRVLGSNIFPAVTRNLNRIYQVIAANPGVSGSGGALFRWVVVAATERLMASGDHTHMIWGRLAIKM